MSERVVTRAIITNNEGEVLLGLRARGHGANQWALVGGKPDENETVEEAVRREVLEELGANFEPKFYLERVDDTTDPEQPWRVFFFTGKIVGEITIKKDEIEKVDYFSQEEITQLDIAFDHRDRLIEFFDAK